MNDCIDCHQPHNRSIRGKPAVMCEECAKDFAEEQARLRAQRLQAGKCAKCGADRDGSRQLCKRHRKAANKRQQAYRAKQKDNAPHFHLPSRRGFSVLVDPTRAGLTHAEQ